MGSMNLEELLHDSYGDLAALSATAPCMGAAPIAIPLRRPEKGSCDKSLEEVWRSIQTGSDNRMSDTQALQLVHSAFQADATDVDTAYHKPAQAVPGTHQSTDTCSYSPAGTSIAQGHQAITQQYAYSHHHQAFNSLGHISSSGAAAADVPAATVLPQHVLPALGTLPISRTSSRDTLTQTMSLGGASQAFAPAFHGDLPPIQQEPMCQRQQQMRAHSVQHMRHMHGQYVPSHMSAEQYEEYKRQHYCEQYMRDAQAFAHEQCKEEQPLQPQYDCQQYHPQYDEHYTEMYHAAPLHGSTHGLKHTGSGMPPEQPQPHYHHLLPPEALPGSAGQRQQRHRGKQRHQQQRRAISAAGNLPSSPLPGVSSQKPSTPLSPCSQDPGCSEAGTITTATATPAGRRRRQGAGNEAAGSQQGDAPPAGAAAARAARQRKRKLTADYITDGMDSDPGGSQAHDLDPDLADERTVRLHNRMVKNRESAARSRLRRQQYTSELEQRVMELDEHNQQLARRLQELLGSHKQQQHKQQEQPQPEPRQPQQPAMGSCGGCGLCGGAARPALRRVKSF